MKQNHSTKKLTQEDVIATLEGKYPDWDFSRFVYVNSTTKSEVKCSNPLHPHFLQNYKRLSKGIGCSRCGGVHKKTTEEFVQELIDKFGNYWNYSKVVYRGATTQVVIHCPEHGEAVSSPTSLLFQATTPCKFCSIANRVKNQWDTKETFIEKATKIYGNLHDYSKGKYLGSKIPFEIICKKHGSFWKKPNYYLLGQGCQSCVNFKNSSGQKEIQELLENQFGEKVSLNHKLSSGTEIDLYLPNLRIGFEYNGLYWHSELYKEKTYHLSKTEKAEEEKIRLIQIFEDEWLYKKQVVVARIKSLLGIDSKIFARKTVCKNVDIKEAKTFLEENHIQGALMVIPYAYGLYHENKLVALMTFSNLRFENGMSNEYELTRYVSKGTVVGGFSKLLKAFIRDLSPSRIISYSDKRWSFGKVYSSNGFTKIGTTEPNYFWCKTQQRYSRFGFQKHKLESVLKKFDPNKTESENCEMNGYFKVFDCGNDKWELKLK